MAYITNLTADHFRSRPDVNSVVDGLDDGLFNVGVSVRILKQMILDTNSLTERDTDTLAATADMLLAYLGQLGTMIDQLNDLTGECAGDEVRAA